MKSQRRLRQIPAVGPAAARDGVLGGEATVDEIAHRVGNVVYRRESTLLVIGVHERSAESPGTADIRKKHADARFQQRREELVVSGAALSFRPAMQENHGADRFDARRRAEQPAGELQPVAGGDGLESGVGGDGPSTVIASIDPPALMLSSLATTPGSGIGSCSVLSASSRICNSLVPLIF